MRVLIKLKSPFVIYAQVAIWLFSPYPIHPTPEKSPQKAIFLAQSKKMYYLRGHLNPRSSAKKCSLWQQK